MKKSEQGISWRVNRILTFLAEPPTVTERSCQRTQAQRGDDSSTSPSWLEISFTNGEEDKSHDLFNDKT